MSDPAKHLNLRDIFGFFRSILGPEKSFYWLAIIYGIGISVLSLATPISVQMLINTVANTGLVTPLVVLSVTLFLLLIVSGLLNALRIHLMEIFSRRFYARMVAEISLRSVYAKDPFFNDASRGSLFNRYFDIVAVQKAVPVLIVGGFTVILQAGVGFVLVSLYHPLFLVFNLVLVGLIWLTWTAVGRSAIFSAIEVSQAKHNTAAWLENLGASNGFFTSERRVSFALDKTDAHTRDYIDARKKHFRLHFAQTLSFLFLFAAASAALLGLGGWLVIQGQLTLGQLVAAELVLSAAFFGVSQLGIYLDYFYDLCAAVEELNLFYEVEQEKPSGDDPIAGLDHTLVLHNKISKATDSMARGRDVRFDFSIASGSLVCAKACDYGVQRIFTNLLKQHDYGGSGLITIGGVDIVDLNIQNLRQNIYVLGRAGFIGGSVREYLGLANQNQQSSRTTIEALETVGLTPVIASLEHGLDTHISTTGWPLSAPEIMQLKLANALINGPRILVINQLYDLLDIATLKASLAQLRERYNTTVIYFSNQEAELGFDAFLSLHAHHQEFHKDYAALQENQQSTTTPPVITKSDDVNKEIG